MGREGVEGGKRQRWRGAENHMRTKRSEWFCSVFHLSVLDDFAYVCRQALGGWGFAVTLLSAFVLCDPYFLRARLLHIFHVTDRELRLCYFFKEQWLRNHNMGIAPPSPFFLFLFWVHHLPKGGKSYKEWICLLFIIHIQMKLKGFVAIRSRRSIRLHS